MASELPFDDLFLAILSKHPECSNTRLMNNGGKLQQFVKIFDSFIFPRFHMTSSCSEIPLAIPLLIGFILDNNETVLKKKLVDSNFGRKEMIRLADFYFFKELHENTDMLLPLDQARIQAVKLYMRAANVSLDADKRFSFEKSAGGDVGDPEANTIVAMHLFHSLTQLDKFDVVMALPTNV
jgi:hypothetical protein